MFSCTEQRPYLELIMNNHVKVDCFHQLPPSVVTNWPCYHGDAVWTVNGSDLVSSVENIKCCMHNKVVTQKWYCTVSVSARRFYYSHFDSILRIKTLICIPSCFLSSWTLVNCIVFSTRLIPIQPHLLVIVCTIGLRKT